MSTNKRKQAVEILRHGVGKDSLPYSCPECDNEGIGFDLFTVVERRDGRLQVTCQQCFCEYALSRIEG